MRGRSLAPQPDSLPAEKLHPELETQRYTPVTVANDLHLNNFDLLRFVAASMVLVCHSYALLGKKEPFGVLGCNTSFGDLAVSIFFVISGYLITSSFERDRMPANFITGRVLRIWPALIAAVCLAVFIIGPLNTSLSIRNYFSDPMTWSYFKNLRLMEIQFTLPGVFASNPFKDSVNGSIWTLPIEVFMYAVTLAFGLSRLHRFRFGMLALVACLIVADTHIFSTNQGQTTSFLWLGSSFSVSKWAIFYLVGAIFFLYRDRVQFSGTLAAICFILFVGSLTAPSFRLISLFTLPYMVLYLAFARIPYLMRFGRFGDFSYGLYVYAFPIQQTIAHLTQGQLSVLRMFVYSFSLTLIAAVLSWHGIENPCLKLKKRFRLTRRSSPLQT
jgi:peptidoglycan/LPS O-acetylase OafA/YrhL